MRAVSTAMTDAWKSEDKTGDKRPVVRATVQKTFLKKFEYDTAEAPGDFEIGKERKGFFTSLMMGDVGPVVELRNIRSCSWSRSVNQDVAECTLVLKNTELTPIGNQEELSQSGDFDLPGYMTYNRGDQANRWGFTTETGWNGLLVPDRMVRTYEGYGADPNVNPAADPNLLLSGTWLIDTATYTHDGDITLTMRDIGSLLLKQICFPPVIPYGEYPLEWITIRVDQIKGRDSLGGSWMSLQGKGKASSSNDEYVGKGLTNAPFPHYVTANGGVETHHASHALENDKDPAAYWKSTGQDHRTDKVWWEVEFNDATTAMNAIRIHTKGGPYKVYISLHNGTKWLGRKKVPYDIGVGAVDIKADIPFVKAIVPERGLPEEFLLPRKYGSIKKMRFTFAGLNGGYVGEHPFWAGLKDVHIYTAPNVADLSFGPGEKLKAVGNYRDYTDIIKWCCAWGGFYWPSHATGKDFINYGPGMEQTWVTYVAPDPKLPPSGRVWGDFMNSGTAGVADLTSDLFEKKPLMDVINYVRDILGFIFFIDETGGVVWRLPNYGLAGSPKLGNYLSPTQTGVRTRSRTSNIVTIDEDETLLSYTTRLSSENIRERIFIGDVRGKIGTVIKGFNPYPQGFRRVAGWTDQNFATKNETRVMADMVATRQMFDYRRSQITIPGYPAVQIDDQIRVFERTTNETFYQYVETISSALNMDEGTWTYELETHWLGEDPESAWVVDPDVLAGVTRAYLNAVDGA